MAGKIDTKAQIKTLLGALSEERASDVLLYIQDKARVDKLKRDYESDYDKVFNSKGGKAFVKKAEEILCVKKKPSIVVFDFYNNSAQVSECYPHNELELVNNCESQMLALKKEFEDFLVKNNCKQHLRSFWKEIIEKSAQEINKILFENK